MLHLTRQQMQVLSCLGDFTIAGGCARDLYHNARYKDIDVNVHGTADVTNALDSFLFALMRHNIPYNVCDSTYIGDGCIEFVAKVLDMDIIFYNAVYDTREEVLASFDYTINQAWIDLETMTPRYFADTGALEINNHRRIFNNVDRAKKMCKLAIKYNWAISKEVLNAALN